MAESYYEIDPEKFFEEDELTQTPEENTNTPETNKAFNETQEYKRFAQAYQPIEPPKDYEYTPSKNLAESTTQTPQQETSSGIDDDVLSSYNSVNSVLKKHRSAPSEQSANKNSSMHYSLKDRTHVFLPTPIYLCESGGKIIINITVNSKGLVTKTYVNGATKSTNECLKQHALEYAKEAKFSPDANKSSQLGSITFYFKGKH
ncbi:hypothetical protein [Mangrovimonas cancribranchiae]|uniref:TonB C-terminal domain-containing protein n=1 Tax=Mangrovimonas cancribranchiae TaxID=3080055 RepID=A0AAU6P7B0_9FLAO